MKKKKIWLIFAIYLVMSFASGMADSNQSVAKINSIFVHQGNLNTSVILETDAPLPAVQSYFSNELPSTITVEIDKVETAQLPQPQLPEQTIIQSIKLEKSGDEKLLLHIGLTEKVPYRIYSAQNSTVIELNFAHKISPLADITSNTTNGELGKGLRKVIQLEKIEVSDTDDKLNIKAVLSDETIHQVFAVDNPLRLVVDLYDTVYWPVFFEHPVNKMGIEKVRAAQFRAGDPHAITRIVCDLTEPRAYSLESGSEGLVLSFHEEISAQPVTTTPPPPPAPPVPEKPVVVTKDIVEKPVEKPDQPPAATEAPAVQAVDQYTPQTIVSEDVRYYGDLVNLRFKDADLRDVVLYLGDHAELNVVFDPAVRGVVTCNLVDIPWDQALDLILKNNKIGKTIEGNVLRVAPIQTLTQEKDQQQRLLESRETAGPLEVKTFRLSYSKAVDVSELLEGQLTNRGTIIVDERTNTLMISEVKQRMERVEKLINVFDTATPQVAIEARIVEANTAFVRNLGIQWGFRGIADDVYGNATSLSFPHNILVDGALIPEGQITKGISGPLGGYAVNLPAPSFNSVLGLSMSNVLDTFAIDMAISALETSGNGKIISRPSVTTQNNIEAEIIQGKRIPVQTVANFSVTTRYVNAALELRATPQITAEDTIIMYIDIRNDAADFANLVNGIPPLTTQSAQTVVMIPDGGTTVIGGIYRTEDSISRERVPFLHKIPILGNLFRSSSQTKTSRELLIFITPRIVR
jgi:type IV pilus assembly protein PilQ